MPTYHDIEAAVPADGEGPVGKSLLRNAITARTPYVLDDADSPSDLVCVDPVTGAAIIDILYLGRLFHYDPSDTTTMPDGVTCLVSYEGRRYKLSDGTDVFAYSVLANSLTAPPVSPAPSIGDAYLIAAAATGAWAGHDNEVGVLTARGWEFIDFGIGRLLYVENTDVYYHRKADGSWATGFGNLTIGANSVPLSAAINFGARVLVENMTTTTPPGSPTVGTAYVIGGGASGSWLGHDNKLAICEVAGTFTIYTPANGYLAYDKSSLTQYSYTGSAWISASGSWVDRSQRITASGLTTSPSGSTGYSYSDSTPPTTSVRGLVDNAGLPFAAKKTGAIIRVHYSADCQISNSAIGSAPGNEMVVALFRDAGANAIDWARLGSARSILDLIIASSTMTVNVHLDHWFEVTAPDASSHTYFVKIISAVGTGLIYDASTLTRRRLEIEEAA